MPELGVNLLSTGKILQRGATVIATPRSTDLYLNDKIIATGIYQNHLTHFLTIKEEKAYLAKEAIWHQRMGHLGLQAQNQLKAATEGTDPLTISKPLTCTECIQAKATAIISRGTPKKAENYLEKVHSDIYGLITPETFSKTRYFASFIDDKTRYAYIDLLRSKDQVFNSYKDWVITEER